MDIESQLYVLGYNYDMFSMDGTEVGHLFHHPLLHGYCNGTDTSLLHLLFFLFSSFLWILRQHWHIIAASHCLLFFSSLPWILWQHWHIIAVPYCLLFSALHQGYCNRTDTSSPHLLLFFLIIFFLKCLHGVAVFILINLCSAGSSWDGMSVLPSLLVLNIISN